jgi:DNA polymerase-3 subunit delta'
VIIGHQQIISQLRHAVGEDRIAGAYLFAGMPNVGKETVAFYFAKSINCLDLVHRPCDNCLACHKINTGNHPDFQVVRPEGKQIKIDQIRQLQRQVVFRPIEGRRKLYIITEANRMNLEAANCLLKTLEEPPAGSVLVLLTSHLDALLPTIRSRCQIISFQPLPIPELVEVLTDRFSLSDDHASSIATLSQGAIGKALSLIEDKSLTVIDQIPEVVTTTDRLSAFRIAEQLGEDLTQLDQLVMWYRDLLLIRQSTSFDLLTHRNHLESLQQIAKHYSRIHLQSAIKAIFETKRLIERNVNATLALEVLVFKLMRTE